MSLYGKAKTRREIWNDIEEMVEKTGLAFEGEELLEKQDEYLSEKLVFFEDAEQAVKEEHDRHEKDHLDLCSKLKDADHALDFANDVIDERRKENAELEYCVSSE